MVLTRSATKNKRQSDSFSRENYNSERVDNNLLKMNEIDEISDNEEIHDDDDVTLKENNRIHGNINENLTLVANDEPILPLPMRLFQLQPFCMAYCLNCEHLEKSSIDRDMRLCFENFENFENSSPMAGINENPKMDAKGAKSNFEYNSNHGLNGANVTNIRLTPQSMIAQYISLCNMYTSPARINPGVLTALRFSLPNFRVSPDFHDADMLALVDLMLPHINTYFKFIKRLDFSIGSKHGKKLGHKGFSSHGAYALSKLLQKSNYVEQVLLQRNKLGFYGATAIFIACSKNPNIKVLALRRCLIGEKGAASFVNSCLNSPTCGLQEVDLSANRIGFVGCKLIEQNLLRRRKELKQQIDSKESSNSDIGSSSKFHITDIEVDLEANLIFQEVMNSVTHGLGFIICIIFAQLLMYRVRDKSNVHLLSCGVYSVSLLVLYISSTLYHSFFSLLTTRYIFEIFDHCAIYILIAGSYTPFLSITFYHKKIWSTFLLSFIWLCCIMGIAVEAFFTKWKYKPMFSLTMYLAMGWCCMICVPDFAKSLPKGAINYLIMGGVAYTTGVPFFVRNNNLDHSIWHCFVLAGSVFHWVAVYSYVANFELIQDTGEADLGLEGIIHDVHITTIQDDLL